MAFWQPHPRLRNFYFGIMIHNLVGGLFSLFGIGFVPNGFGVNDGAIEIEEDGLNGARGGGLAQIGRAS
jgi:hypothetical protein